MTREEVVIVGAGITGLSIAHQLRRTRPSLKLTILARDLPSDQDYSQSFGSVWAGADWSAFATAGSLEAKWETQTYDDWLIQTQKNGVPSELMAFVDVEKHVEKDEKGLWCKPWWKDVVKDFKVEAENQDKVGILRYKSFCLDAPQYLLYLFHKLIDPTTLSSADGLVEVHRTELSSLQSVKEKYPTAKVVINASGLGADKLVENGDPSCQLIRGQTLLVRLPADIEPKIFTGVNSFSSTVAKEAGKDLKHELSYIIPRARSGKVILGGSYEPNRMDMEGDTEQTARILRDSAKLWPALIPSQTTMQDASETPNEQHWREIKVLRVNVGFRPGRSEGPRVEVVKEKQIIPTLHAYGLGGAGYQRSVGVALTVDEKLDHILDTPRIKSSSE